MAAAVALLRADNSVADSRVVRLEWVAPLASPAATTASPAVSSSPVPQFPAASPQFPVAAPSFPPAASLPPATAAAPPVSNAPPAPAVAAPQPTRHLDRQEIAILMQRGQDFVAARDLGSARLMFRRAAEAGDARAALAMGQTYDPSMTAQAGAGFADVAQAREWYQKAATLGAPEARQRLEALRGR
jgi:hypothetical protein